MAEQCVVEVTRLYYRPDKFLAGEPERVEINITFGNNLPNVMILPPENLTDYHLCKLEPRFRTVKKRSATLNDLHNQYWQRKEQPKSYAGLYFEQPGGYRLPDGNYVIVQGDHLIGECPLPYYIEACALSPMPMKLPEAPLSRLADELLCVNKQALLAIAYLFVTLVRSWIQQVTKSWQAVLMIVGKQGMGKTTLAERLTGWYTDENGDNALFFGAGSTPASMRDILVDMRDLPVVIDDLCLSASPSVQRKAKDLGAQFVREGANAAAITKKKPGGATVRMKCGAGLILTAEFALENGSDITRCIYVIVNQPLGLPESLTSSMIGAAAEGFLAWFTENEECEREMLESMLQIPRKPTVHQRVWKNCMILQWGMKAFLSAAEDEGSSRGCCRQLFQMFSSAMEDSIRYQHELLRKLDAQNKKGNLPYLIVEGFYNDGFDLAKKPDKLPKHEGVIWKDDLCLRPEALERFVRMQDGYQNYTLSKISQELKDIGALVLQEAGTAQVKLRKDLPRVYRLRLDVLESEAKSV